MFGLEKRSKRPKFKYDLEKDLEKDFAKGKAIISECQDHINNLKTELRGGSYSDKEKKAIATLLHGYEAAAKVVTTVISRD